MARGRFGIRYTAPVFRNGGTRGTAYGYGLSGALWVSFANAMWGEKPKAAPKAAKPAPVAKPAPAPAKPEWTEEWAARERKEIARKASNANPFKR
jgi:hypothetical protein